MKRTVTVSVKKDAESNAYRYELRRPGARPKISEEVFTDPMEALRIGNNVMKELEENTPKAREKRAIKEALSS